MKKTLILVALFLLFIIPSSYAANDFSYNRLYEGSQPIDGFNYSINVNHSTFTDSWITPSLGLLTDVNSAQFDNIAGALKIDTDYLDLRWLRLDGSNSPVADINWSGFGINNLGSLDMTGDIDMDYGNIFNATEVSLKDSLSHSSFLNITTDLAGGEESQINIINTNDFGYSGIRFVNSIGDEFFAGTFGRNISSIAFPNIVDGDESLSGIASVGGPVFIGTTNNDSIYLGGGPSASLLDTDFFLRINPILKSIEIQGDKLIRPVATGSIQTMVFESNIGVSEGETTFGFFATDINNNSIIQKLMQIGHNNSASVLGMNSQIVASKDYLTMPVNIKVEFDNNTGSPIIEEWFDNKTNCFFYEEYLQGLGLVPEGLQYFCDTLGRLVPQSILGDLSVVRGIVGHEGATLFENLDVVIRDNSTDVDIIGGRGLHIRRIRIEEIGVAPGENVNRLFADFEQDLLDPFILITSGKGSDEWGVVADEDNCPTSGDFCVHAGPSGGSAATIMESNITTSNTQGMNLTFTINTFEMSSGGLLTIDIKNSTTSNNLYTLSSTDVSDLSVNVSIPSQWNNLSLVTISASFLSTHPNRGDMWIDEIIVNGIASASTLQNVTREDGEICLSDGKSRGDGSNRCIYDIFWNDSSKTLNLPGNTTFDHVEEQDLNITRSVTLNGTQIFSWGDIPDFFKLNGSSIMQGNANFGGFDLFNIGSINFSGLIYGNASQMTGITHTENYWNKNGTILSPNITGDTLELTPSYTQEVLGTPVSGSFGDGTEDTIVAGVLVLDRASSGGGIFNTVSETGWNGGGDVGTGLDSSPKDTEWNTDGWNDLSDIATRTYSSFFNSLGGSIGNNIVNTEMVMHIISTNQYYKVKFSSWGSANGLWTYERTEIISVEMFSDYLNLENPSVLSVNGTPRITHNINTDVFHANVNFDRNLTAEGVSTFNGQTDFNGDTSFTSGASMPSLDLTGGTIPWRVQSSGGFLKFTDTTVGGRDPVRFGYIKTGDSGSWLELRDFASGTAQAKLSARQNTFGYHNNKFIFGAEVITGGYSGAEILNVLGNLWMTRDNDKILLGAGKDASITYSGTNMVFNSQETGSGDFVFENGDVGIGTTTPEAKLHVKGSNGGIRLEGAGVLSLQFKNSNDDKIFAIENFRNTASGNLEFNYEGSTKMVIEAGGNVGIGTTSPVSKLHVVGDIKATGTIIVENITLSNGAIIGGNSTCAFIFYNQTGSIINTMGC